jgi:hypothetical protein
VIDIYGRAEFLRDGQELLPGKVLKSFRHAANIGKIQNGRGQGLHTNPLSKHKSLLNDLFYC